MKKEIKVDTPPIPLGTLEVAILDLAGCTALQAVWCCMWYARCLMRPCRACSKGLEHLSTEFIVKQINEISMK